MKLRKNNNFKKMAQSLDGLRWFLPNKDFKVDLIDGIREGKGMDETLNYLSDYVWNQMTTQSNLKKIREKGLYGKKQYYPDGNWTDDPKKPGNGYLKLDLAGDDMFLKYQIKARIKQYSEMIHEYDLLESLTEIKCFQDVRMATLEEDTKLKADLVVTDLEGDEWLISVYKSTDEKAISKLGYDKEITLYNRITYNVCKYGKANLKNTNKWVNDLFNNDKNILFLDESKKWNIS